MIVLPLLATLVGVVAVASAARSGPTLFAYCCAVGTTIVYSWALWTVLDR